MKLISVFPIIFLIFFWNLPIFAQEPIKITYPHYGKDENKKLIVINQPVSSLENFSKNFLLLEDELYHIENPTGEIVPGTSYLVTNSLEKEYVLYFTHIPIIHIYTDKTIADKPRVHAEFTLCESTGNILKSHIGIEYRGATSQAFAKKSYRLEFWENDKGINTKNVSLLGMRLDDDWNLQSLYNEPLKLRSKTSNEIWLKMYKPYYQDSEPGVINGIHMEYVELFVNNSYRGIYCLGERVDRKQLQLKKYKSGKIRGELYKGKQWAEGIVTFTNLIPYQNGEEYWDGFQYKYPDEIQPFWNNLYDLSDFIINTSDEEFYTSVGSLFDMENAIDYHIFINLLWALDNTGKNTYLGRLDENEPYFYIPWDLDCTFGLTWIGSKGYKEVILTNGLYDRLWEDYREGGYRHKLQQRWQELRADFITPDYLFRMFLENYYYLKTSGAFERERIAWKDDYVSDPEEKEIDFLANWIPKRIDYLDTIFNEELVLSSPKIIDKNEIEGIVTIQIYNLKGQSIRHLPDREYDKTILNDLEKGVYILHISNKDKYIVKKVIIP